MRGDPIVDYSCPFIVAHLFVRIIFQLVKSLGEHPLNQLRLPYPATRLSAYSESMKSTTTVKNRAAKRGFFV
jgi:hypothetical protein